MSPSRSTRSRKIVKLKRKPPPRPQPLEAVRPEGGRQADDRTVTQPAERPRTLPVNSKTVAIWSLSLIAVAGLLAMLIAAATWVYDASAPASAGMSKPANHAMPTSPRGSAASGDTRGGTGRAGRMVLIDGASGSGSGGGSDDGASAGANGRGRGSGRSSTCTVQVTTIEALEKTLGSCIEKHNAP